VRFSVVVAGGGVRVFGWSAGAVEHSRVPADQDELDCVVDQGLKEMLRVERRHLP
jgi:hypothetical protein